MIHQSMPVRIILSNCMHVCRHATCKRLRVQLRMETQSGSRLLKEALQYNDKLPNLFVFIRNCIGCVIFLLKKKKIILSKIVFEVKKEKKKKGSYIR